MPKVVLISFDAVGSDQTAALMTLPNFKKLMQESTMFTDMHTVFVSNTYPVHASVATGVHPHLHGIRANTRVEPDFLDHWCYDSRQIRSKTIWQAAHEKKLKTAAVLWPVTGYDKTIAYNVPESRALPGKSQVLLNLTTGSLLLQLKAYFRHKDKLKGIEQPELDTFSTAVMADIIREKKPDLMLLHLTCYDDFCHRYGKNSPESLKALGYLDQFLGQTLDALSAAFPDEKVTVIVFSDHDQINFHTVIETDRFVKPFLTDFCWFFNSGGTSVLYNKKLSVEDLEILQETVLAAEGVERLLTEQELQISGFADAAFGVSAKEGYYFCASASDHGQQESRQHKAGHGYTLDREGYKTFCAINKKMDNFCCTSVLDITKLVAAELSLSME